MKVSDMHKMRVQAKQASRHLSKKTPLAKEIERYRDSMIREVLANVPHIIQQQLSIAQLTVSDDGENNDTVLKATNSLLDRTFGKPKESIDFTGNVQFSLKDLAQKRSEIIDVEVTPLEELI
jgi:hypothetical protein